MAEDKYVPDLSLKRPGEQKKVLILEETVEKGSLQDLKDVLETYKSFELTARALGLAARYRGIDFVRMLVEHGATFSYHNDTRLGGRYDMYRKTEFNIYWTDYALMLIPEKFDFSSYKPLTRSRSSQGRYEFTPLNGIYQWIGWNRDIRSLEDAVLPLGQRLEITDYLSANKVLGTSMDDMLYWALIWGEIGFADGLTERGAELQNDDYLDVVTEGWNLDSFIFGMSVLSREMVLPVIERFYKQAETVGEKPVLSQYLFDVVDWEDHSLSFVLSKADLSKINQIKALEKAVMIDGAASLSAMEEAGWMRSPARRERMIQLAQEQGKTNALAFLIDFKNRTADFAEEDRKQEARIRREMTEKPDSVSALKKSWKFEKMEDRSLRLLEYKGGQTDVIVPAKIGKDIVTVIGESAFRTDQYRAKNTETRKKINSVMIRDGIRKIERDAFRGCASLKEISIPDSVTEIGKEAFYYCSALKTVRLPDTVGTLVMGENIFEGCSALKVIENKESIQKCLMNGSVLVRYMGMDEHAEVPEGTTRIGKTAFRNNGVLKSVSLPDSLKSIEDWAFNGCGSLDSVIFPQGLVRIGEFAFYGCSSLSEAILPPSLKEIGYGAFMDTSLKEVVIPESVNELGERVFSGCASLRTVTLPSSLTEIRYETFKDCVSLQSVSIPESVRKIGTDAFSGCKALEEVIIPETVTEIGDDAFKGVPGVKRKKSTDMNTNAFSIVNGTLQEYHGNESTVIIPDGVRVIQYKAFRDKKKIRKVVFPDSLIEICGDKYWGGAFEGCTSLASVSVPEGVREIGAKAFAGCKGLKKAELPGIRIISKGAFSGCAHLKEVVFGSELNTVDGDWHNGAFEYCGSLEEIDLPEGTVIINQEAFAECGSLRKVRIPTTMRKIGWRAFYSCSNLVSFDVTVAFPEGGTLLFGADTEAASKCIEFAGKDGFSDDHVYLELIRKGTLKKKVLRRIALMRVTDGKNRPSDEMSALYSEIVKANRTLLLEEALNSRDAAALKQLVGLDMIDEKQYGKALGKIAGVGEPEISAFALEQKALLFAEKGSCAPDKEAGKKVPDPLKDHGVSEKTETAGLTAAEARKQWFVKDWNDGTLGIYGYKGDESEITIPARVGKKRVTTLLRSEKYPLYRRFSQFSALTKVVISCGIEKIEEKTFEWWYNPKLTAIVIPPSVTTIEEQDFRFSDEVTIYGEPGSCAEKYAAEHGIAFIPMSEK